MSDNKLTVDSAEDANASVPFSTSNPLSSSISTLSDSEKSTLRQAVNARLEQLKAYFDSLQKQKSALNTIKSMCSSSAQSSQTTQNADAKAASDVPQSLSKYIPSQASIKTTVPAGYRINKFQISNYNVTSKLIQATMNTVTTEIMNLEALKAQLAG